MSPPLAKCKLPDLSDDPVRSSAANASLKDRPRTAPAGCSYGFSGDRRLAYDLRASACILERLQADGTAPEYRRNVLLIVVTVHSIYTRIGEFGTMTIGSGLGVELRPAPLECRPSLCLTIREILA